MNNNKYIITGFLVIIPIFLTFQIAEFLFGLVSGSGVIVLNNFFPDMPSYLSGIIGFSIVLLSIYIIGMLVSNIFGKKILSSFDRLISDIPVINMIYKTIKQITSSVGDPEKESFKKVVLIEYPRRGVWTLAMVTGESKDKDSNQYYNVYLPTTPNPTSGFMLYTLKSDILETNLSVEEGLRIIISGGVIGPEINDIIQR